MEKIQKITKLRNILAAHNQPEIARKQMTALAIADGLVEKDTYIVQRPQYRGTKRGQYSVSAMVAFLDTKIAKKSPAPAAKAPAAETFSESDTDANLNVQAAWGDIAYTDDDVADELSLMGTYL